MTRTPHQPFARHPRGKPISGPCRMTGLSAALPGVAPTAPRAVPGWKSLLYGLVIISAFAGSAAAQVYHWKNFAGKPGEPGNATGPAGSATFTFPSALALDAAGNLYVGELNRLCKITAQGDVLTLAGNGQTGATDGVGPDARFGSIRGLAVDGSGTVYVADVNNRTIRKVTSQGVVTTIAGSAGVSGSTDGPGSQARFGAPTSVALDANGFLYIADQTNHTIRRLNTATNVVERYAGVTGSPSLLNGARLNARFNSPDSVAAGPGGMIFVSDLGNRQIRLIRGTGQVETLAGDKDAPREVRDGFGNSARFDSIGSLAADAFGNCFLTEVQADVIRKVTSQGAVSTIGGAPGRAGSSDGLGVLAQFDQPWSLAAGPRGVVYVADTGNHRLSVGTVESPQVFRNPNGTVSVYWRMSAGANYDVQRSPSLRSGNWATLGNASAAADGSVSFIDANPLPEAFYRLKSVPVIGE